MALLTASQHDLTAEEPTPRARCFRSHLEGVESEIERRVAAVPETAPFEDWYKATLGILKSDPKTDALFFHNAHVAPPVLRAIEDAGRRVGKDFAVTTYDDPAAARWLGTGLSVVHEPTSEVADALAATTVDVLTGEKGSVRIKRLSARFVSRQSTALGS